MPNPKPSRQHGQSVVSRPEDTPLDRVLGLASSPLVPNESEEAFTALAMHVVNAAEPADAIEEILVRDVIDLTWEIHRIRRAKAGLVKVSFGEALKMVLFTLGHKPPEIEAIRRGWITGKKQAQQTVHRALLEANLSLDDVMAQTIETKLESIERLDRMLASAEARRNNALREIDRHREALGVGARRAIEEVEDVEFTDVGSGVVHPPSN